MRTALLMWTGIALLAVPARSPAQETDSPWQLRTRVVLTGSSKESEPPGYQVYSAIALEAAVRRTVGHRAALELSLRTESREVDRDLGGPEPEPQGSVELLPVTLTLLYAPRPAGSLRPYVGAGVSATIAWEKSGALNSADLTPQLGPALQLGLDWAVSPRALINLDARWNPLRPDLQLSGQHLASLRWDTMALGVGVGLRL